MYKKAYGVIETLAPLHVGATAGEESGNLNLIFRDQFTQTGVVPGSSIRGRLRSEMRLSRQIYLEQELDRKGIKITADTQFEIADAEGQSKEVTKLEWLTNKAKEHNISIPPNKDENLWYGHEAVAGEPNSTTESLVKFEYASIIWLPVFCPGQPIVWVTCPRWLKRYKRLAGDAVTADLSSVKVYSGSQKLDCSKLFFNFGFLTIDHPKQNLTEWFPDKQERPAVIVGDDEIAMIHDMALYRQTRIAMEKDQKVVENFFGVEALPEETILIFPIAHRSDEKGQTWKPFTRKTDIYLGGLESIGFGHCELELKEV
jgi:CRISPR-associated protein Cmr4